MYAERRWPLTTPDWLDSNHFFHSFLLVVALKLPEHQAVIDTYHSCTSHGSCHSRFDDNFCPTRVPRRVTRFFWNYPLDTCLQPHPSATGMHLRTTAIPLNSSPYSAYHMGPSGKRDRNKNSPVQSNSRNGANSVLRINH